MVDQVDLSEEQRQVFGAVAALEAEGSTTTIEAIARRAGLHPDTARTALSYLIDEADLVRELDPDAEVVGPRYSVKEKASPS